MAEQRKLLDRVRDAIRLKHYSIRTEQSYVKWIRQFIFFHNKRHPMDMAEQEVEAFLTDLAVRQNVAASTQNQALNAIVFLYKQVLKQPLGDFSQAVRAKRPIREPVVLTEGEARLLLTCMSKNQNRLVAHLLYGSGMRLIEAVRLRVQDLDFTRGIITVRAGKGDKDRKTCFPHTIQPELREHLKFVKQQHLKDLNDGYGAVYLPNALARKYPNAETQWNWQYVFPSSQISKDPRSPAVRRHHVHVSAINKSIRQAARLAAIPKKVSAHSLRHSFATHLLEAGTPIHSVQELLGHQSIETTQIYLHCLTAPGETVISPLDRR